jgi:hypothetical protein
VERGDLPFYVLHSREWKRMRTLVSSRWFGSVSVLARFACERQCHLLRRSSSALSYLCDASCGALTLTQCLETLEGRTELFRCCEQLLPHLADLVDTYTDAHGQVHTFSPRSLRDIFGFHLVGTDAGFRSCSLCPQPHACTPTQLTFTHTPSRVCTPFPRSPLIR